MQIDQFRLDARPRSGWQTLDLGIQFAKQNYWPLFFWYVTPALLTALIIGWLWNPVAGALIAWWLKPLWERPGMLILSERVFNARTPTRQRLKRLHKIYWQQLFASLLWRRLSPSRSFDMPVMLLEGLKGKRRRARLRQLHSNFYGHSTWWLILLANLEIAVMLAAASAIWLLLPQGFRPEFDLYFAFSDEYQLFTNIGAVIGSAIIAPFFSAGGFALYIQQRIHLDCWDVQLAFSQIAERGKQNKSVLSSTLAAVLVASLMLFTTPETQASAQEDVADILASPEFNDQTTFWYPDFSHLGFDPFARFRPDFDGGDAPELPDTSFLRGLALFIEVLVWIAVGALIIWIAYMLIKRLPAVQRRRLAANKTSQSEMNWQSFDWQALQQDIASQPRVVLRALRQFANQSLRANVPLSDCLTEVELSRHGLDSAQKVWLTALAKEIETVAWAQQVGVEASIKKLLTHCPWEVRL